MKKIALVTMTIIALVVLLVSGCATPAPAETYPEVFKLGSLQPLTGAWAYFGKVMGNGVLYAVEEINESGELPFKLEVVEVDHKGGDTKAAMAGHRKLIDVDKVSFIATSWGNIVPLTQVAAAEAHIPCMNGGAMNPELADLPYLYNVRLMLDQLSIPLVEYMVEEFGMQRPAIIHWNDPGGTQARDATYFQAPDLGLSVVASEGHEPGNTDYRAELARIKAADPDALLIWSHATDIGYIAKQAHEMGLNVPMATLAEINPEAIEVAGAEHVEGMLLGAEFFDVESERPEVRAFVEGYTAWAGEAPESMGANYYDITYIMFDAIKYVMDNGGDPFDGEQLNQAILDKGSFRTLYGDGTMELLESGTVIKTAGIWVMENGQHVLIKTLTPPASSHYPAAK